MKKIVLNSRRVGGGQMVNINKGEIVFKYIGRTIKPEVYDYREVLATCIIDKVIEHVWHKDNIIKAFVPFFMSDGRVWNEHILGNFLEMDIGLLEDVYLKWADHFVTIEVLPFDSVGTSIRKTLLGIVEARRIVEFVNDPKNAVRMRYGKKLISENPTEFFHLMHNIILEDGVISSHILLNGRKVMIKYDKKGMSICSYNGYVFETIPFKYDS